MICSPLGNRNHGKVKTIILTVNSSEPYMPVADYQTYCRMLDRARERHFAYPATNVTSLTTANAALRGLAEAGSDGIIQLTTGGAAFASGTAVKDMVPGAISIAEHVHRVAEHYPIYVALHTDHCPADLLDSYVIPLVEERIWISPPNCWSGSTGMTSSWNLK